jgi:hypothetical protein
MTFVRVLVISSVYSGIGNNTLPMFKENDDDNLPFR